MKLRFFQTAFFAVLSCGILLCGTARADSLREVVRYAMKTNPRLLATESVRLATDQQLRSAQAGYLPTVDVTAGYGREGSRNPTTSKSQPLDPSRHVNLARRESNIRLNQNLFHGFFDENNVLRNRHRLRSRAYSVQQEVQNVALESTEKYLEVLRISIIERLAQRNLEVHDRIFKMIKKRTDKGLSRKADLEQAKGRTSSSKARLIAEQGRLKDARTEYVRVVGRAPMSLAAPPPLPKGALPDNEEVAVELAEKRNPALKSARSEVDAAVAQFKATHSANYPSFDFELSAKSNYNVDGVRGNDKDYAAMFRMNYNLFKGGADLAHQREMAHVVQESYEIRNRTHRQVIENMRLSWNALLTAQLRINDLKSHKESAWETVLAYRKQFQLGQRTLLDLLDAENEWFLSSVAYINDKFNEFFAQYRILHSMGYLVQVLRLPLPSEAFVEEDVVTFIGPKASVPGVPEEPAVAAKEADYDAKSPAGTAKEQQQAGEKQAVQSLQRKRAWLAAKLKPLREAIQRHTNSRYAKGTAELKALNAKVDAAATQEVSSVQAKVKKSAVLNRLLSAWKANALAGKPVTRYIGNGQSINASVEDSKKTATTVAQGSFKQVLQSKPSVAQRTPAVKKALKRVNNKVKTSGRAIRHWFARREVTKKAPKGSSPAMQAWLRQHPSAVVSQQQAAARRRLATATQSKRTQPLVQAPKVSKAATQKKNKTQRTSVFAKLKQLRERTKALWRAPSKTAVNPRIVNKQILVARKAAPVVDDRLFALDDDEDEVIALA